MASYRAALAVYAKTAADLPREPPNQADVIQCRRGLASTLAALGRTVEAADAFRQLAKDNLQEGARPSKATVEDAQRATDLAPKDPTTWSLLALAQYRLGDWKAMAAAAKKAIDLPGGGTSADEFLLAIAEGKSGNKSEARKWHEKAVASMPKTAAGDGEIKVLRAEAEKLLGQ